jgi:hypothetical protein
MSSTSTDRLVAILREAGHDDPTEFLRVLAKLFAVYPDRNGHSPERWEGYVENLADLPLRAMQWACAAAIRTSKFLPLPAEIRERVTGAVMSAQGVGGAEKAWSHVLALSQSHGERVRPEKGFGDPVTDAIMTGVWWRQIKDHDVTTRASERKLFVDAYRAHEATIRQTAQRGTLPALPAPAGAREALRLVDRLAAQITSKGEQ